MMQPTLCFIEPLDVLFLRGNKLFGDPGSHGESLVPPWPSLAAGALRSRMLTDDGVDLAAFGRGEIVHPILGTPSVPGPFAVTAFNLARLLEGGRIQVLFVPPADIVLDETSNGHGGDIAVSMLRPTPAPEGLLGSCPLPLWPVLAQAQRVKPVGGYWLTDEGWRAYLQGDRPAPGDFVHSRELWGIDARVGVGLDAVTGRAADGRLFSVQAVAMHPGVGFVAAVSGAEPPSAGMVRLGGDGRAAALGVARVKLPETDYAALAADRRCRLVLTTPGVFDRGWLPHGSKTDGNGGWQFELHGVRARLSCASVPRSETVSGWDLAGRRPKTALRAAPAGTVYWLEDIDASEASLRKLVENGLWGDACEDAQRRAEGFNRCTLAAWH